MTLPTFFVRIPLAKRCGMCYDSLKGQKMAAVAGCEPKKKGQGQK